MRRHRSYHPGERCPCYQCRDENRRKVTRERVAALELMLNRVLDDGHELLAGSYRSEARMRLYAEAHALLRGCKP